MPVSYSIVHDLVPYSSVYFHDANAKEAIAVYLLIVIVNNVVGRYTVYTYTVYKVLRAELI